MGQEIALHRLLEQVKRVYQSSFGRNLSTEDWIAFQSAVEAFGDASGGSIFGGSASAPSRFLVEPATSLELSIPDESTLHRRARTAVRQYDFVFQAVRGIKSGLKHSPIVDAALRRRGLSLGMDLGPFEKEINALTAEEKVFPQEGMCGPYWDLYWHKRNPKHGYEVFNFKFAAVGIARFHRQRWTIEFMGVQATVDLSSELYDAFAKAMALAWSKDPGAFVRSPLLAVQHERFTFERDADPRSRIQTQREVVYRHVAAGVERPPERDE